MGEYQGQVTRHGILQGGNQVVAAEALLRGPASSLEVTEGLNHDSSSAEHVGQLGNVLAVFNGFVEGFGKVLAYQKGKVGVVCLILLGFVRMAVYHCKAVFVIFCGHLPGRIGTEGADLVVEGGGIVYQLGFIQVFV